MRSSCARAAAHGDVAQEERTRRVPRAEDRTSARAGRRRRAGMVDVQRRALARPVSVAMRNRALVGDDEVEQTTASWSPSAMPSRFRAAGEVNSTGKSSSMIAMPSELASISSRKSSSLGRGPC